MRRVYYEVEKDVRSKRRPVSCEYEGLRKVAGIAVAGILLLSFRVQTFPLAEEKRVGQNLISWFYVV